LSSYIGDAALTTDRKPVRVVEAMFRWMRTNFVTAVLGYNITTMLKQPVSIIQGALKAGKANTIKAAGKFMEEPDEWIDFVGRKSVMMRNRGFNIERELREMMAKRGVKNLFGGVKGLQKFKENAMRPALAMDKATTTIIWLAAYDSYIADGKGEVAAKEWADEVVRTTQPMGGLLHLPAVFRGSEYQKMWTVFKNQLSQNTNLLIEASMKTKKGTMSKAQFTEHVLLNMLVSGFVVGLISRKRLPKPDEVIGDAINQVAGSLVLISQLLSKYGVSTPAESFGKEIHGTIFSEEMNTRIASVSKLLALSMGIPYVQFERFLKRGATLPEKIVGKKRK